MKMTVRFYIGLLTLIYVPAFLQITLLLLIT